MAVETAGQYGDGIIIAPEYKPAARACRSRGARGARKQPHPHTSCFPLSLRERGLRASEVGEVVSLPPDLLKQFGPGMIFRYFPLFMLLGILEARTNDPSDVTSLLFIAFARIVNYIQTWSQTKHQVSTARNVAS